MRGGKANKDKMTAKTVFQWALLELREELGVTAFELSESLAVPAPTMSFWFHGRTFPKDAETFNRIIEAYPEFRKWGTYYELKADHEEWSQSSRQWPTRKLTEYCKSIGLQYFKNDGVFRKSDKIQPNPEPKKEETKEVAKSEFQFFINEVNKTPQGRTLIDLLEKTIEKLPDTMSVNLNCIKDDDEYNIIIESLNKRIEDAIRVRQQLTTAHLLLRKLRLEYLKLREFGTTEEKLSDDEEQFKDMMRLR